MFGRRQAAEKVRTCSYGKCAAHGTGNVIVSQFVDLTSRRVAQGRSADIGIDFDPGRPSYQNRLNIGMTRIAEQNHPSALQGVDDIGFRKVFFRSRG